MIYILSGPVQSGKSTSLMNWCDTRANIGGFLTPDVHGTRQLYNIVTGHMIPFEAAVGQAEPIVRVGMFEIREEAFHTGLDWVITHMQKSGIEYIVLDELGKLELDSRGFHQTALELLRAKDRVHIVFVIRDYLLADILSYYGISEYTMISASDLQELG